MHSPGAATGEIGGNSTGEMPVAEGRSETGGQVTKPDFDRHLSNLRPLDTKDNSNLR